MSADWPFYLLLAGVGCAAGFVDAVAGGGGLLTVPALLWAGLTPAEALATNKLQSSCGTALAVVSYARAGLLRERGVRAESAVTFTAALAGAWAVTRADPAGLRLAIPWLLLAIVALLWLRPALGAERRAARLRPAVFAALCGTVLGFYDGFFGPGAGTFWTMAFILLLGLDLRAATAHTKAVNLASNLAALAVFLAAGHVRFDIGAAMAAGQLAGARLGARLVIARGTRFIRPVFLTVALALAARLLWASVRG